MRLHFCAQAALISLQSSATHSPPHIRCLGMQASFRLSSEQERQMDLALKNGGVCGILFKLNPFLCSDSKFSIVCICDGTTGKVVYPVQGDKGQTGAEDKHPRVLAKPPSHETASCLYSRSENAGYVHVLRQLPYLRPRLDLWQ